ncbi:MAG: thiaminase II [Armatimonadetes bacterium]|nr:thiaminase II [Armatimonadota bacterium]
MRFSDHLRQAGATIWEAQHVHPFVRGLGDGSLDLERFKVWVRQDYLFLIDYARVLAYAAARVPDLATMGKFAELCHATLSVEMGLHRAYAAEFGITVAELERETKAPTTQAYADFLMRAAAAGTFPELAAALLPCMWGYADIGARLARGPRPRDPRYAKWIEMYASPEFTALAEWCRGVVDRLGAQAPADERRRMEEAFTTSLRYEYLFWDMAYGRESWNV